MEAWLRTILPLAGLVHQLFIAPGGFASGTCPADTPRSGRMFATHAHFFQNSWVLLVFAFAGLLSLAQTRLRLPASADQGFLALGFGLQALFLGLSPLPDEQEAKMYLLLYILVSALAVLLLVEVLAPHAFLVTCGRVYTLLLASIWYFTTARVLYEGRDAWATTSSWGMEMGPTMFVGVLFTLLANATSCALFFLYVGVKMWHDFHHPEAASVPVDAASCSSPSARTERSS